MSNSYVSRQQIASLIGVTPRTVSRWVENGLLPHPAIKCAKTVRWDLNAVLKALRKAGRAA